MLLPTKHIKTENALIGVGAQILRLLSCPQAVAVLFHSFQKERETKGMAVVHFDWFLLALDFLYAIEAVEFKDGLLRKQNQ